MKCPDPDQINEWAQGSPLLIPEPEWEDHLAQCESCRKVLDSFGPSPAESNLLKSLAEWKREQETFLPTLRTVLASSFRVKAELQLSDFPFIESIDGRTVTGRIGRLELRELIGSGSMGAVFRAFDAALEREVAVKVLRPEYAGSEEVARLFLDEARAAAALKHLHILPIYEVSQGPGEGSFYVMPLVAGGHLGTKIVPGQGLLPGDFLETAAKAASALAAAHAAGIMHRDVKPSNILLEGDGGPGVWLADFGLARAAHHGFGEGSLVGTPGYVAPEIANGGSGSDAADVFSLGVTFEEMRSGRSPRKSGGEARSSGGSSLDILIHEMTQQDPARRPKATEVVSRLETIRQERGSAAGRRLRVRRLGLGFTGVAIGLIGLFLMDTALAHRPLNRFLKRWTGSPISVDGYAGTFTKLDEALKIREGDLTVRIADRSGLLPEGVLTIKDRSVTLIAEGALEGAGSSRLFGKGDGISVQRGELHLVGLDLRFRSRGGRSLEGIIEIADSVLTLNSCSVRRVKAGARETVSGEGIFLITGNSRFESENSSIGTDRTGKGFIVVGDRGTRKTIKIDETRFAVGGLLQFVVRNPETGDEPGVIDVAISQSTVISSNPIRLGRDGSSARISISSKNNLWQCIDALVSVRGNLPDQVRENFRFQDEDSFIAVGGETAIEVNSKPAAPRVQAQGNGAAAKKNWDQFWNQPEGESAEAATGTGTRWVDWIVIMRPSYQLIWNDALDLTKKGMSMSETDLEDFE